MLLSVLALPAFAADSAADDAATMKRFIDALVIMKDNNADPVDMDQAFYGGAVPGLLRHLDPHSSFFDPSQFEQLNQMQRSTSKVSARWCPFFAGPRDGATDAAEHTFVTRRDDAGR